MRCKRMETRILKDWSDERDVTPLHQFCGASSLPEISNIENPLGYLLHNLLEMMIPFQIGRKSYSNVLEGLHLMNWYAIGEKRWKGG